MGFAANVVANVHGERSWQTSWRTFAANIVANVLVNVRHDVRSEISSVQKPPQNLEVRQNGGHSLVVRGERVHKFAKAFTTFTQAYGRTRRRTSGVRDERAEFAANERSSWRTSGVRGEHLPRTWGFSQQRLAPKE